MDREIRTLQQQNKELAPFKIKYQELQEEKNRIEVAFRRLTQVVHELEAEKVFHIEQITLLQRQLEDQKQNESNLKGKIKARSDQDDAICMSIQVARNLFKQTLVEGVSMETRTSLQLESTPTHSTQPLPSPTPNPTQTQSC